jgi:DNA-binding NarL/FixJ family response regulator
VLRAGYELQRLRPAWKIVRAEDGVLALLQIPRFLPDVIAFDLGMSGVDPLEAVKGLQGRAETAGIKLLGLSEKCGTGIAKKALATGIHACLERPFSAQKLATAIESVMGVQPLRELGGSIDLRLFP